MSESTVPETDTTELARALAVGGTVIDVREPEEYAEAHVPGVVSVPLSQLAARSGELDRDRQVLVVCASGNRSKVGAEVLIRAGFDAVSVRGGTRAWMEQGHPVATGAEPGSA